MPDNLTRALYGARAVTHGSEDGPPTAKLPYLSTPDAEVAAADAIANILHWLDARGAGSPARVLDLARLHYTAEAE